MNKDLLFSDYLKTAFKNSPEFEKGFYEEFLKLKIGEAIHAVRIEKGISQQGLAEMIGTSQSTVARLEQDNNYGYSLKTLLKIAHATGKELDISFKDRTYSEPKEKRVIPLEKYATSKPKLHLVSVNDALNDFDEAV